MAGRKLYQGQPLMQPISVLSCYAWRKNKEDSHLMQATAAKKN
jgi:hypothetical protein